MLALLAGALALPVLTDVRVSIGQPPPPATRPSAPDAEIAALVRQVGTLADQIVAQRNAALDLAAQRGLAVEVLTRRAEDAEREADRLRGELVGHRRGLASAGAAGVPAATDPWPPVRGIGVNIDKATDWDGHARWVDLTKTWRPPVAADGTGRPARLLPSGFPAEDCQSVAHARGYPAGVYRFAWSGAAKLRPDFGGRGKVVARGDGWVDVELRADGTLVSIDLRGVDPADPVTAWSMPTPGEAPGAVYRRAYLEAVRPFRVLRFMPFLCTNSSPEVEWADRTGPEWPWQSQYAQHTGGAERGSAWEYAIRLSNDTGRPAWVNVPHGASDDYVRRLARLWRDRYDPRLELAVEYSNETWNSDARFQQYHWLDARATAAGIWQVHQAARELYRVARIWREEWGPEWHRVKWAAGSQAKNPWIGEELLKELDRLAKADGLPGAAAVVHAVAPALYFDAAPDAEADRMVAAIAAKPAAIDPASATRKKLDQHKALAARFGLAGGLWFYEGGWHVNARSQWGPNTTHPGMGAFSANWAAAAVREAGPDAAACHFTLFDEQWGLAPRLDQLGPKYQALAAAAAAGSN